ncbi:hypothetical protein FHS29_000371 [Saccharothrix tamanrassetensis]|uniref:Uncharacterized protein n=1 Tax=Saccharothrix tamanrassetensis TaxID=1051531 RepID=A0A841C9G9_9PSEU|nr:hypothetical protein [Saccharothrix tamanrassetensis]MBB5953801.1 hypothetical protein [Saccharothrix tamanrassetensis]
MPSGKPYPDIPVPAIGGTLDSDFAADARALAGKFPRGRAMAVPFGGHSATLYGVGPYGECLAERARTFIADPSRPVHSTCSAETYRALGRFPRTSDELPPTHVPGLATAYATAADATARRNPGITPPPTAPPQPGLRGGTVTFDDPGRRIVLDADRYTADIAVSGEIRLPDPSTGGSATADLTTSDGHTFQPAWRPFEPRDVVVVTGTADGVPFTAALRNS